MVGIIGVLIIVVPAPSAKVNINNKAGVVTSKRVSIPSIIDTVNMYPHVMSKILRRSKMSDNAPDGKAKRKIGRVLAVVIRETNKGFLSRLEQAKSLAMMQPHHTLLHQYMKRGQQTRKPYTGYI